MSHLVPSPLWSFWVSGIKGIVKLELELMKFYNFSLFYFPPLISHAHSGTQAMSEAWTIALSTSKVWPFTYLSPVSRIMVGPWLVSNKYLWHGWLKWYWKQHQGLSIPTDKSTTIDKSNCSCLNDLYREFQLPWILVIKGYYYKSLICILHHRENTMDVIIIISHTFQP